MQIIPAIDLKDGKCVRLRQGRMEDDTVFDDDPVAVAVRWLEAGARRIHLVDLDGAFAGVPRNAGIVKAICAACPEVPVQIGGGIRSVQTASTYLDAGIEGAIVGRALYEGTIVLAEAQALADQFAAERREP